MIRLLREFRLIPVVLLATFALFALKTFGLLLDGGYILDPVASENAAPAAPSDVVASDDVVGSIPALNQPEPAAPPPPLVTAPLVTAAAAPPVAPPPVVLQSWAHQMFNFPEVTGSVGAEKKEGAPAASTDAKAKPAMKTAARAPDPPPNALESRMMSPAERAILERLQDRRKELETRSRQLDMRETLIKAAEKRLDGKVAELKQTEARIKASMSKQDAEETQRFNGVVAMYENMKPKDAARIFDRLDMKILVDVASHIKPRTMADIMAQMSPETAERLTVEFASRANGPHSQSPADLPKIEGQPTAAN